MAIIKHSIRVSLKIKGAKKQQHQSGHKGQYNPNKNKHHNQSENDYEEFWHGMSQNYSRMPFPRHFPYGYDNPRGEYYDGW